MICGDCLPVFCVCRIACALRNAIGFNAFDFNAFDFIAFDFIAFDFNAFDSFVDALQGAIGCGRRRAASWSGR